jgi:hypothetical protein
MFKIYNVTYVTRNNLQKILFKITRYLILQIFIIRIRAT